MNKNDPVVAVLKCGISHNFSKDKMAIKQFQLADLLQFPQRMRELLGALKLNAMPIHGQFA